MTAELKDPKERSFHTDASSKYLLPNDSPEHARLEAQHRALTVILERRPSRAPVSNPAEILDVGCGTGCMTTWLADSFPAATVTGLDLSLVPKLREQPANARFLKGNVLQQSPRDWISEDGDRPLLDERQAFDLIFSRLLIAGIGNWEEYIVKLFSLLKPGGWVECQELNMVMHDSEDRVLDVWQNLMTDWGSNQIHTKCGEQIKGLMEKAGFEKVGREVFKLPIGSKGQPTQELREMGDWFLKDTLEVAQVAAKRSAVGLEPEAVEALLQKTRSAFAEANGWHMKFYVSFGRKPE